MPIDYDLMSIKLLQADHSDYKPRINSTFALLGMLNEYMGRLYTDEQDFVEQFYPTEKAVAESFVVFLKATAKQNNIRTSIKLTVGERGHFYVSSVEMQDYIRSLYDQNFINSIYGNVHGISESMFPPTSGRLPVNYQTEPVDPRFSYLHGAYLRYGKGNAFQFSNAVHKIDLIIRFLEQLGAKWVSKSWTINTAPIKTIVHLGADPVLARLFGIEPMGVEGMPSSES